VEEDPEEHGFRARTESKEVGWGGEAVVSDIP